MPASVVPLFDTNNYDEQVRRAADALRDGQLVILPTETVYGAAARLDHPDALARLRALPPQADAKPLVIHLPHRDEARHYLGDVSDLGRRMMRKLWPGPVGILFDVPPDRQQQVAHKLNLPVEQIYDHNAITLRAPDHVATSDILAQVPHPVVLRRVAGPSAQRLDNLDPAWLDQTQLVIDTGPTKYSKPSTLVRLLNDHYEIVRAGVYDQRIIDRLMKTTLLFVCSGNTCRSPMAEAIARQMLAQKLNVPEAELEKKGINVLSAGSFAMPGARAAAPAVEALRPAGVDLTRHRSRPLSVELIHQADVIYTMSRSHAAAVTALVPSAADKVLSLNPDGEIEDPIGGDVSLYQSLALQLRDLISKRLEQSPPV